MGWFPFLCLTIWAFTRGKLLFAHLFACCNTELAGLGKAVPNLVILVGQHQWF